MTKLIALFFSTLFFLQSTNIHLGDVQKIGELFEHYDLHNAKYDDSFAMFLSKHYGNLKESHKEQHQEERRNHHHDPIQHDCTAQAQIDVVIVDYTVTLKTTKFIESKETNFYYQNKFSTFEKQQVFQPPQLS